MANYIENLIRGLPGEALVILAFSESFIGQNIDNIASELRPIYGIVVLVAVFITTFLLKLFATGIAKFDDFKANNTKMVGLIFTLIVSLQAVCYSMVVIDRYIFIDSDILLLVTFISIITGLVLSAIATIFPKS